jgi:hypothetical protein
MVEHTHPVCEAVDVVGEDEQEIACGEPAKGYVVDATGKRHYACLEHAGTIKAHVGSGEWIAIPANPPARPYPESLP